MEMLVKMAEVLVKIANENSPWYGYRFGASQLVNKDYELLGTWTVDFREHGSASTNYVE